MSELIDKYKEAEIVRTEGRTMGRVFNIGLTLLILISVILLCSSVALYIIKENEIEKRIYLERELEKTTKRAEKIAVELEELKTTKTKMDLELALKDRELQDYKQKFNALTVEWSTLEGERSTLAEKSALTQKNLVALKKEFEQVRHAKEMLEQKLKKMMASRVKLKTIIVEPEATSEEEPVKKTQEGEILAVNKEYDFLVISLGLNDGLAKDSDISIYRGAELIAAAKIEKLYENISAVVVNDRLQMDRVKVGDTVVATVE